MRTTPEGKVILSDHEYPPASGMASQVASIIEAPKPYDYPMTLVTRKSGEGFGDVAIVLSRMERIALQVSINESLKISREELLRIWRERNPELAASGHQPTPEEYQKGLIWNMIEGVVESQERLLDRLREIGPVVEFNS